MWKTVKGYPRYEINIWEKIRNKNNGAYKNIGGGRPFCVS